MIGGMLHQEVAEPIAMEFAMVREGGVAAVAVAVAVVGGRRGRHCRGRHALF